MPGNMIQIATSTRQANQHKGNSVDNADNTKPSMLAKLGANILNGDILTGQIAKELKVIEQPSKMMRFNVLGTIFMVHSRDLLTKPDTRLGQIASLPHDDVISHRLVDGYLAESDEYFFKRLPSHFQAVLGLYCNGKIHKPGHMCKAELRQLLDYWQIALTDKNICEKCSQMKLAPGDPVAKPPPLKLTKRQSIKKAVWSAVDDATSKHGRVFLSVSMAFLFLNILLMILDSYKHLEYSEECTLFPLPLVNKSEPYENSPHHDFKHTCCYLSIAVPLWFTLEFFLRLLSCPNKKHFFKNWLNWADFLAFFPFYLSLMLKYFTGETSGAQAFAITRFLRLLKIIQVVRLMKFARTSKSFYVMIAALQSASQSFALLFMIIMFFVCAFATAIYYAEAGEDGTPYTSIPTAAWWTITTYFAYSDAPPVGVFGQIIAATGAILGIVVLAFPVGLILDSFTTAFNMHLED